MSVILHIHRYIQGMKTNSKHLSSTTDSATLRSSGQISSTSLPKAEDWFGTDAIKSLENVGGPSMVVKPGAAPLRQQDAAVLDALWQLRDHMNKESWKLASYLDADT